MSPLDPKRRRRTVRLAILLLVLAGVSLWAGAVTLRRMRRTEWKHTLHVAVVALGPGGVPAEKSKLLNQGLPRLSLLFTREFERYRPDAGFAPVEFVAMGGVGVSEAPPMSPETTRFLDRALYAFELSRYFRDVDRRGGLNVTGSDARIYIMLQPAHLPRRFVEGVGALNGDLGIVESQLDASMLDLTLTAIGHEFLHCVGATDKYDEEGHAQIPEGLPEPDTEPRFPQRWAEIMVGERALSEERGRLPETLEEVAIGPATAAEIGWLPKE